MAKSKAKKLAEELARAKNKTEHWLIIDNPWYSSHRQRRSEFRDKDLQEISWWLQVVFGLGKVQVIQHKTNSKHIIVIVDLDVDIKPKLGCHRWETILSDASVYERREDSKFFEYDYIRFGNQSERGQWVEYYPLSRPPPVNFPVVRPYRLSSAVWCERFNLAVDWALPIDRPLSVFNSQSDPLLDHTSTSQANREESSTVDKLFNTWDPRILHHHVPQAPTTMQKPHLSSSPPVLVQQADPPSRSTDHNLNRSLELHPDADPPTHKADLSIPIAMQSAAGLTFRPYHPPSHHPSHPLTLPYGDVQSPKDFPPTAAVPEDVKLVKREPSLIRVPFYSVPDEEEEKKVKRDPSPIRVPYPEVIVKKKAEEDNTTFGELMYPDSDIEEISQPISLKMELSDNTHRTQWLSPNGKHLTTSLILIQHPFGVNFPLPGHSSLPEPSEVWDWLQLIADGALALYFDWKSASSWDENWLVARIHGYVDLQGVLGQHRWAQILESCPARWEQEVSTISLYPEDPESRGLRCLDSPGFREDYGKFAAPYPAPYQSPGGLKGGIAATKRLHEDDSKDDGMRKHAKIEVNDQHG